MAKRQVFCLFSIMILLTFFGCVRSVHRPYIYQKGTGLVQGFYHKVEQGETLWKIAKQYRLSLDNLHRWNNKIEKRGTIYKDQLIFIPKEQRSVSRGIPVSKNAGASLSLKKPCVKKGFFAFPIKNSSQFRSQFVRDKTLLIETAPEAVVSCSSVGFVRFSGKLKGMGTVVLIDHGLDYTTVYAHLKEACVQLNDRVLSGQKIGVLRRLRKHNKSVLHFEIRQNGVLLFPLQFFR